MNLNLDAISITAILAGSGAIMAFWGQIKGLLERLKSYVVCSHVLSSPGDAQVVAGYLLANFKISRFGRKTFALYFRYVISQKKRRLVPIESPASSQSPILFWKGKRFLFFTADTKDTPPRLTYIRGMFNINTLLGEICDFHTSQVEKKGNRYKVIENIGLGRDQKGQRGDQGAIARTPFPEETDETLRYYRVIGFDDDDVICIMKEGTKGIIMSHAAHSFLNEVRKWLSLRLWYKEKMIPWRRGYLFSGDPGTGKTCTIRAIAEEVGLPVYSFNLASMTNREFVTFWNDMTPPCIVLLEDIDSVFDGRKSLKASKEFDGITFDCLINTLDGIRANNGILTIITTNDRSRLDPALVRPGRIDREFVVGRPTTEMIRAMCLKIIPDHPEDVERVANEAHEEKLTMVQIQERCVRIALGSVWDGEEDERDKPQDVCPQDVQYIPAAITRAQTIAQNS